MEMACVHNVIMRALNGIYRQALTIQPADYKPFVCYSYSVYEAIKSHYKGEEENAFPEIEEATSENGIMDTNIH